MIFASTLCQYDRCVRWMSMKRVSPDAQVAAAELTGSNDPISREAACRLLRADDDMLPSLLSAAQLARARFKPGIITYSRKVFFP